MLNLNEDKSLIDLPEEPEWKVLIYDKMGQDIISPLIKVGDLRMNGVTVHMGLHGDRQHIPDVPAVYFVEPNDENIARIAADICQQLYDSYYINFSSVLPRTLLEELASKAAASAPAVKQVYDQYLNYVCLEENLFSLQLKDSYTILNNPISTEHMIDTLTTQISSALFSIFKGNAAEMVATKLEAKLRNNIINSRATLFPESLQLTRPVLILLDRNIDLASMLSHTWTYSTLVHDVLGMNLNRVIVSVEERGRVSQKHYDIDVNDYFWSKNAGNPFPQVAEDVDTEINKYKQEVDQVTRSAGVNSLEEMDPNDFGSSAKHLSSALKMLPELTNRKKLLDMHMNIATALFKAIQLRQLDVFFSMEESIQKLTKSNILEIIKDPAKDPQDKIRLFLIFFLSSAEDPSKEDIEEYEKALQENQCDIAPLSYAKSVRMYTKIANIQTAPQNTTASADLLGSFTSNFSKLTDTIQNSAVSGHFETLISGVKNLLPTRKELPVTRTVDALMEGTDVEDYLYLDPKLPKGQAKPKQKITFQDAVVFVIGGGNYLEYQNLCEYAQRGNLVKKRILYGTTEILTAKNFMEQLTTLGRQ